MAAEAFSINFSLIVENSPRREEHHLNFSDPRVEETFVSYEGDVLAYTLNICPATVVTLRCCRHCTPFHDCGRSDWYITVCVRLYAEPSHCYMTQVRNSWQWKLPACFFDVLPPHYYGKASSGE